MTIEYAANARGVVKTHSYEQARGVLLGTTYSDGTTARAYTYNHLGQLTQVVDDAGTRTIGYNAYNEQETDSLLAGGKTHLITELRDGHGRSSGYTYALNGSVQQTVSTGYGTDGRIASAGFVHGGAQKLFTYSYLPGTNLLQTLVKPNNMTLTQSYEEKRDLLIGQLYKRSNTSVASRSYSYDTLGRPVTRSTSKDGSTVNDTFGYNSRSELNTAMVNNEAYAYDYDNIGNRETAQEAAESATTYESNNLNQYTAIGDFEPTYDDAGNQTTVKTTTDIWSVIYNAENRPTSFTNADNGTIVECSYDYMGRRATKKVTVNGTVTLHQRFLYRGYLQIACCDLTRSNHPCLWLLPWDPSQPVATRPLAIQKDGTWYTYGWDLTKNICEVYGQHGYIRTNYSYSPYGEVTISGDVIQPIQWSSEINDEDTSLVYYNYRYFEPQNGKWLSFDPLFPKYTNSYLFAKNNPLIFFDINGLKPSWSKVVNAYDEDVLFDDLVGSISLKIKIDDEDPVNSSRIVFYGRDGDIAYQKHDTIIEEIDNETKVITFSATVSASLVDYGDALMIGGGIAGGATTGAIIGGGIGTLAGGVVAGPGAAAGSIIGGVVGGIGGACYGSDVSVSLLLKAKLTCKCTESQWIPTKIEDFSENARGKAKRNGDLYINVK